MKTFAALLCVGLLCSASVRAQQAPAQPALQEWGTILGRVVFDGKAPEPRALQPGAPGFPPILDESLVVGKNGGLANVFVYVRTKQPFPIHPGYLNAPAQNVRFESRGFRYQPHALAVWTEDQLLAQNKLDKAVDVNFTSAVQGTSALIAPGEEQHMRFKISETLPKPVVNNFFPWMSAQLLVRDNPYFCVTDEQGIFCIPNLPQGQQLEFQFWHERIGMFAQLSSEDMPVKTDTKGRVTLQIKGTVLDLGEFRVDPKLFEE